MEKRPKPQQENKFEFKARKVPDFSKVNSSVAGLKSVIQPKALTQFVEFNLSGENHHKQSKIQQPDKPVAT